MPSSMPTAAPTYDSPRPGSAWWIQKSQDERTRSVIATTGYAFVAELQRKLRDYFHAAGHNTFGWQAYTAGRGDVPETRVTDLDTMGVDGNWGPKTNAALWIWLLDQFTRSGRSSAVQFLMDQVELVQVERHLNINALRAAVWIVRYVSSPLSYVTSRVALTGTVGSSITLPPYNREAPRPAGGEASAFHIWDPDASPMPPELSSTSLTPTPGPGSGPAPAPGPGSTIVAPETVSTERKRYLGLTALQWLLLGGVAVGGSAVAYTVYKKKGAKHGTRGNPYDEYDGGYDAAGGTEGYAPYALPSGTGRD